MQLTVIMLKDETYRLVTTKDGSHTLVLKEADESYHSLHGAIAESTHIYINCGLKAMKDRTCVNILEVGFGTGLNALLTYAYATHQKVFYHAVEPYPLEQETVRALNYPERLNTGRAIFEKMHEASEGKEICLRPNFFFTNYAAKISAIVLQSGFYDIVYFDLFKPALAPELWETSVFLRLFKACKSGAVLVTYSAKGKVRRAMQEAGFFVERLPGPEGKREILRAVKK